MSKVTIFLIAVVVLILICFGMYVSTKNTLVSKNEAVKSAWSQVDVVLQRRADLIPNLVETVKGITKQEQAVFGEIAQARSQLLNAQAPADKRLEGRRPSFSPPPAYLPSRLSAARLMVRTPVRMLGSGTG